MPDRSYVSLVHVFSLRIPRICAQRTNFEILDGNKGESMTTTYPIADMMIGVRNMIEAADLRRGDQVLLLADTRSDKQTMDLIPSAEFATIQHPAWSHQTCSLARSEIPPLPTFRSGGTLVDIADRHALYQAMEGHDRQARKFPDDGRNRLSKKHCLTLGALSITSPER
jgi:hypothetical protein